MLDKLVVVCLAIASLACVIHVATGDAYPGDLSPQRPRAKLMCEGNTPEDLLFLIRAAYLEKDIALYSRLLHDAYRFQFCERDYPEGVWWSKSMDVDVTGRVFADPRVMLTADFPVITGWQACRDEVTGLEGLCCCVRPRIVLTVQAEEPWVEVVEHSAADIMVVENPPRSGCWQILLIRETLLDPCEEGCVTWGSIKSMYR